MQTGLLRILLGLFLVSFPVAAVAQVEFWLTDSDKSVLFQKQPEPLSFATTTNKLPTIAVDANLLPSLPNVAFRNPEGRHVLIVLNNSRGRQTCNLLHQGRLATLVLNRNAVGTFVW